jgi:integrase
VGKVHRQAAVYRCFQADLTGSGLAGHRVHDLRHTFVSLCADAGMAADVATRWTHTAGGASARQLYLVPSWERQAAEMLRLVIDLRGPWTNADEPEGESKRIAR